MTDANSQLKAFVERIERIEEEIKASNEDKRDIYAEAKSNGYDVRALKIVIGRRRKNPNELSELETLVDTYEAALGTGNATRVRAQEPRAVPHEQQTYTVRDNVGDGLDMGPFRRAGAGTA